MPGLVGIIGERARRDGEAVLKTMLASTEHERFHVSRTQGDARLGLWAGWTCLKGAFADHPAIWNETKDVCLIFSGEEFSDRAEADALRAKGHTFEAEGPAWLVHLYEEAGLDCFQRLNGWFSGVLLDLRAQKVVLFNDRYGFNRIYYHQAEDGFYFASEAKALLKVLPGLRRFDMEGLGEAVSCGCALRDKTIFSGISLLPGGAAWVFSPGQKAKKQSYFSRATWEGQPQLSEADFYEKLRETFPRILRKYLAGPNRIGMSLTGGLDGRMIMAWANRAPGTLPCYTFGSAYRDCTDVMVARRVASACHQEHRVLSVDGDFLREFPALAERAVYLSDGALDATGAVELYANRIAREIAPVRLTGNYGSEIVRRSVAFRPGALDQGLFEPDFERNISDAAKTYAEEKNCQPLSFIAFKQVPWHHYSRLSVELSQLTLRAPFLDNELVALMYQAPPEAAASKHPSLRLIADGNSELGRIPTDRGLLLKPGPVLDRARNLCHEFTFKAEYAYDYGMPQWLAKIDHAFSPLHLERLFLGRHKFYHFRVWYRDKLAGYLKDTLLDSKTLSRSYLRKARLEQIVNDHVSGRANYTSELHKVLRLELIQRQLLERQ
jgi:asparagine synthase (glutamine-hydrolysing)